MQQTADITTARLKEGDPRLVVWLRATHSDSFRQLAVKLRILWDTIIRNVIDHSDKLSPTLHTCREIVQATAIRNLVFCSTGRSVPGLSSSP